MAVVIFRSSVRVLNEAIPQLRTEGAENGRWPGRDIRPTFAPPVSSLEMNVRAPSLGLRANLPQFMLLVLVNAFVGGMVGIERSILPALAQEEFGLAERTAILSFIAVFGVTKATANYFAGRFGAVEPQAVLVAKVAAPVPFLLMWAPTWTWVVVHQFSSGSARD